MTRLLVALVAAVLLLPASAAAQAVVGPIGPGGLIYQSTAQVSASTQVATAQTLLTTTIAPSLIGSVPAHVAIKGYLGTAQSSAGTMTIACSYGGTSLTIVSAQSLTAALQNVPIYIDYWILPTATGGLAKEFHGEVRYIASGTTYVGAQARTSATLTSAGSNTLTCTVTFSDTTIATGIIARSASVSVGEN